MHHTANLVEGILWLVVASGFLVSLVRRDQRLAKLIAACNFAAFGLSDFVEMGTGAWWRPWWLLVWKGLCVTLMLLQFVAYVRRSRTQDRAKGNQAE